MSETADPDDMSLEELYEAAKDAAEEGPGEKHEESDAAAPDCPRCGSGMTECDVTTDIPGDGRHDYGCNDCLYVWGES